jgi:hypothetical protein
MAMLAISPRMLAGESTDTDASKGKFGVTLGYRALTLHNTTYAHNTHPDDFFLPNASTPGSAGTTTLDGRTLSYMSIGIQYQKPIFKHLVTSVEAGGLFGGGNRDDHQNINDPRPAANAAFVYSQAADYGFYGSIGLAYQIKRLSLGINGDVSGIFIDSGWDRYSNDQSVQNKLRLVPTVGPKIGWQPMDNLQVEGGVGFGGQSRIYYGKATWVF